MFTRGTPGLPFKVPPLISGTRSFLGYLLVSSSRPVLWVGVGVLGKYDKSTSCTVVSVQVLVYFGSTSR